MPGAHAHLIRARRQADRPQVEPLLDPPEHQSDPQFAGTADAGPKVQAGTALMQHVACHALAAGKHVDDVAVQRPIGCDKEQLIHVQRLVQLGRQAVLITELKVGAPLRSE